VTGLIRYDAACRALAEAKAVDEVKEVRDQAEAMRVYARQAKNRDMEIDAAEIRMRAERRLGQMLAAQKEQEGFHKGGRPKTRSDAEQVSPITLDEVGIDRKLSSRAQKMAAVSDDAFESIIAGWRETVRAENERVTVDLLRHGQEEQQREARRNLARTLSDTSAQMTGVRKYPCVYADPAVRLKAGIGNRSYENHYPTMSWDKIMALPVRDMVLPDAWLFLWLPRAHLMALHEVETDVELAGGEVVRAKVKLPLAWAIARAWSFDSYSTLFVWTKTDEEHPDDIGTGFVVRDQDEVLCLFKKGKGLPKPAAAEKFGSNHRERSKPLGHSRKPEHYRRMIVSMTGGLPVLEIFARVDAEHPLPKGWNAWGNEANALDQGERSEPVANGDITDLPSATIRGADGAAASSDPERIHPAAVDLFVDTHGCTASSAVPEQANESSSLANGAKAGAAELPAAPAFYPGEDIIDLPDFLRPDVAHSSPIVGIGGPR
jgi:N6-adenosine-specific RNA methylase IME4